jgi:spore germination cell wall hydrolase CwlJ-like protein
MKHLPNLRLLSIKAVIFTVGAFFLAQHSNFSTEAEAKERLTAHAAKSKAKAKKVNHVDAKQLRCLAYNIYYEAGGESEQGKAAVARVVMNRVKHGFAKSPCAVIYQSMNVSRIVAEAEIKTVKVCQFSWVCENKGSPNKQSKSYKQSERIAYQVLANNAYKQIVSANTLFFHNLHVSPNWNHTIHKQIGNHIFYEKGRKHKRTKITLASN